MEMPQVTQDTHNHLPLPFNPVLSHLLTQFDLISLYLTKRVRIPKLQHPHRCPLYGLHGVGPLHPVSYPKARGGHCVANTEIGTSPWDIQGQPVRAMLSPNA